MPEWCTEDCRCRDCLKVGDAIERLKPRPPTPMEVIQQKLIEATAHLAGPPMRDFNRDALVETLNNVLETEGMDHLAQITDASPRGYSLELAKPVDIQQSEVTITVDDGLDE